MTRSLGGKVMQQGVLIVAAISALFPLYVMVTASLKTQTNFIEHPLALPSHASFHAYKTVLNTQVPLWFKNSAILTLGAVGLTLLVACPAAWGFTRWRFRGRDTALTFIVSLMVVPPVVLIVPLFVFGVNIGWISTFRLVILIYTGLMLPFSIYMLSNFFKTIPRSLIEAAIVDGASTGRVFRRIVIPLSMAPIATLAVINTLFVWTELLIALVFLQDDTKRTLMVGITDLQSKYSIDVPVMMAGLALATAPIVALYLVGQRFFSRGLVSGATKG
jgi:raffinose/stachyose/melibiose transport system permease protein